MGLSHVAGLQDAVDELEWCLNINLRYAHPHHELASRRLRGTNRMFRISFAGKQWPSIAVPARASRKNLGGEELNWSNLLSGSPAQLDLTAVDSEVFHDLTGQKVDTLRNSAVECDSL